MATELLLRYSYPKQPGDQPWSILDLNGPTSYVTFVPTATPPTGGQLVSVADFGLQAADIVLAMSFMPNNLGGFYAAIFPVNPSINGDFSQFRVGWYNLATFVQPAPGANLSTAVVRLLAIGR